MRWLFYADTPLQLYLSTCIALTELGDHDIADVMICDQSLGIESIANKLVDRGAFQQVYSCSPIASRWKSLIVQFKDFLGKSSFRSKPEIEKKYDRFALSVPLDNTMDLLVKLRKDNPSLDVVLYEDGTGTYDGQIFKLSCYLGEMPKGLKRSGFRSKAYHTFGNLFPNRPNVFTPSSLYLRIPDAFEFDAPFPLKEIKKNSKTLEIVESCFFSNNTPAIIKSAIFLDTRRNFNVIRTFDPFDDLLYECIDRNIPVTLRSHPGSKDSSPYSKSCVDGSGGLWEIICNQDNVSNSLLVGCLSTAQLAPFLENGSRPPLLFLHKLMIDDSNPNAREYDELVEMIRRLYGPSYEDRICNAESYDQALRFLLEYKDKLK